MAISVHQESRAPVSTVSAEAATDDDLVAAVRQGSDPAFEQLYGRYHRRIAAFAYGRVADYGRAEDIAQEVFISALRRMRATERPIAFRAWIYEIAKNACIDQYRRSQHTDEISYDAEEGAGAVARGRLATTLPSPSAQVDQKVAIANLRGAFGGLSPVHHEILVLREFEGLSYREIGKRLDMSHAAVESTLFRARRRLTEEYEELVSGERCGRVQDLIATAEVAAPGVRDQRRLRAHLSHCQPCRRGARLAGLDDALFVVPGGVRAKVAAFFPLPAFLQRRWGTDPTSSPVPSGPGSALTQLAAHYGASIDPAMGSSWAKAVVAAATLAAAGAAGGHAVSDQSREYFGGATPKRVLPSPQRTIGTAAPRPTPGPPTGAAKPAIQGSGAASTSSIGRGRKPDATAAQPKGRAAKSAAEAPAAAGSSTSPAPPIVTPEKVVGALAPPVRVPEPAAPAAPTAIAGTAKEVGRNAAAAADAAAAANVAAAAVAAAAAGRDAVRGATEAGRGATGPAAPAVPAVPGLGG